MYIFYLCSYLRERLVWLYTGLYYILLYISTVVVLLLYSPEVSEVVQNQISNLGFSDLMWPFAVFVLVFTNLFCLFFLIYLGKLFNQFLYFINYYNYCSRANMGLELLLFYGWYLILYFRVFLIYINSSILF